MTAVSPTRPTRALALLATALLLAACSGAGNSGVPLPSIPSEAPATPTPEPTPPGPSYPPGCPTTQPASLAKDAAKLVTIVTPQGTVVIKVDGALAPIAGGNFVALAACGYYTNTVYFRTEPNALIQGGDGEFGRSPDVIPDLVGSGGPPYTIKDDPLTTGYTRGAVALSNAGPGTTKSQFFIVTKDFPPVAAQRTYPIIGHVVSGMDVVDAIALLPVGEGPGYVFNDPPVMTSVTVSNP